MERRKFLALLLICAVAMLSVNYACATSTNHTKTKNVTDSIPVTNKSLTIPSSSNSVINQSKASVKGLWLQTDDLKDIKMNSLKKSGITDVYIKSKDFSKPSYTKILKGTLNKFKNSGIRVHIWVVCFKDGNGKWIDPQGKYAYKIKIPYIKKVKVPYQVKVKVLSKKTVLEPYYVSVRTAYKEWYKSEGEWKYKIKYKWSYKTKYRYKYKYYYKWINKTRYKSIKKINYRYKTKYGYNNTYQNYLLSRIVNISKNFNISGILLDDVSYSGSGQGFAYKNANATKSITSFVKKVFESVKSTKPNLTIGVTVIPSKKSSRYYGQDYSHLSRYLDYMVPKLFKGTYHKNSTWIASMTRFIVGKTKVIPIYAGIQTYQPANIQLSTDLKLLSAMEIRKDLLKSSKNGANGFILYRYGLISPEILNCSPVKNTSALISMNQLTKAATNLKQYIESKHKLPAHIKISNKKLSMPQFLKILVDAISTLNKGTNSSAINLKVKAPSNPHGDLINGQINKTEYLKIARKVKFYIEYYQKAPNFIISSKGKIQYESLIYVYARSLTFYGENNRLPGKVDIDSFKISFPPSASIQYLKVTKNCQSNDSNIKTLAKKITSGAGSSYQKAQRIFKWVRDNISYSFYYNTKFGAIKTLINRSGNCVDHAHLVVALARAAGIPARYVHGKCVFSSGNTYGHVWAQLLVKNRWYNADATSTKNKLGVINNWNTKTAKIKGNYIELPF